jgi:CheY-like chemotaxis protein
MQRPLLVIEDRDEDFEVLKESLHASGVDNGLTRCATGREVSRYLSAVESMAPAEYPAIVLLDLNIPGGDGRNILRELRSHPKLKTVPIVVLTTSSQPADIETCYSAGASGYMVKPVDLDLFESMVQKMAAYWLGCVQLPADAEPRGRVA